MKKLTFNLVTLFPKSFSYLNNSKVGKEIKEGNIKIRKLNILKNYPRPDDAPFGGGGGMILKPTAFEETIARIKPEKRGLMMLPSPDGRMLSSSFGNELLKREDTFTILCPRYEGFDARIPMYYKMVKYSIGKYVVSDGDIAAMVFISFLARRVLLDEEVIADESFENSDNCEHDLFTKPRTWNGLEVPEVLLSGNHKEIENWRKQNRNDKTKKFNNQN